MPTCECGQPATEVCYRRGDSTEIWFCRARKHTPQVRALAAQGWLSQSANVAASPTGAAIRRHLEGCLWPGWQYLRLNRTQTGKRSLLGCCAAPSAMRAVRRSPQRKAPSI